MDIEVVRPAELTDAQWRLWAEFQESEPALDSPYFRPEFTQAVAHVRRDVEVALLRKGGRIVGFFPFQRGALQLAKPVGGKMSDYHGVVCRGDLEFDAQQLLRGCRLAAWDFDHVVASQTAFQPSWREPGESPYLDLSRGFAAYAEGRKAAGSDEIKRLLQKRRKLERERGSVRFEFHTPDLKVLQTLQTWKSAQYVRTGFTDVFSYPWTGELLEYLLLHPTDGLSAVQSVLWHGERPIAIQYCLRSRGVLHSWFPAYDQEYAAYSPGSVVLLHVAETAEQQGVTKIDMGKGTERYKWSLASASTAVAEGTVGAGGPTVWLMQGWRRTRDWVNQSPLKGAAAGHPAPVRALAAGCRVALRMLKPLRAWFAFR